MTTKKLSEVGIMNNAHGVDARNLYNTKNAMITVITMEPGQSLKCHITPVDVAFYILEGTGVVEIGGEKMKVTKDTLIESPKDIVHCWFSDSIKLLRFMVIKVPKSRDKGTPVKLFVADQPIAQGRGHSSIGPHAAEPAAATDARRRASSPPPPLIRDPR